MHLGIPVSLTMSGTLILCGGSSLAIMLNLNSSEYLVVMFPLSLAPQVNTNIQRRDDIYPDTGGWWITSGGFFFVGLIACQKCWPIFCN